jgi:alkylation response protein AidB-like acyl-CoA dehydrogenase
MDFKFTPEEEAFRQEVLDFLEKELPAKAMSVLTLWEGETDEEWELAHEFTKKVAQKGWLALWWPKEYGGLGGSDMEYLILNEEMAYHRAPRVDVAGTGIIGPTILVHGTEEQKRRFLPPTARAEIIWCQGYTEPGAGSDSAAIQTRAVQEGDDYIINGQKVFTSLAHHADYCYLTTRTDPNVPKHEGLSYFLVDLKSPGVTIRPLLNLLGAHSFNEIYFDDVRVPKENMLGKKNGAWKIMMTTLNFERGTLASMAGQARRALDDLIDYAKNTKQNGKTLSQDPLVRQKLIELAIEVQIARLFTYRVIWMQGKGDIPSYEASLAKTFGDELNFRIARIGMEILGLYGQLSRGSKWAPLAGWTASAYQGTLGSLFAGGTPEIQRNIIARIGLRLPRG